MESRPTLNHIAFSNLDPDLAVLIDAIGTASKAISLLVRSAALSGIKGLGTENINASGQHVSKIDSMSHDILAAAIVSTKKCCAIVSEEANEWIAVDTVRGGQYCVFFDPLDGSSNVDCNNSVGTIFAIHRRVTPRFEAPTTADVFQSGNTIVCSGYTIYGSSTEMVLADSNGVNLFTQDPGTGEFVLVRSQLMIPAQPKTIYSINEGNSVRWYPAVSEFINSMKQKEYSARYVGSMVADIHRTLLYGGIFMYPGDKKNQDGKLRLLYEVNPMSFIIEKAGGKATTGSQRAIDVLPTGTHQRCPVVLGCVRDVSLFEEAVAAYSATSTESEHANVIDAESTRDVWHANFPEHWEDAPLWASYMFERQCETASRR